MIIDYKKNIYANIKEQNITQYVPAGKMNRCFSVTFTKEKIYTIFGKDIKRKITSETMPFVFKSLDVAKDFCKVCPTVVSDLFVNRDNIKYVKYHTYRLVKNDKTIGFIKWNKYYTYMVDDNCGIEFIPFMDKNSKIIDSFVKDINLKSWDYTFSSDDIKFEKSNDYLSNLIENENKISREKETYNEWNFKLIEQ